MNKAYIILLILFLPGCKLLDRSTPQTVTVVTPAGSATGKENDAVSANLAASTAALTSFTAGMSKVSASAGNVKTFNSGQPPSPKTDGVAGEATIIQSIAGEPSPADALAASERARIVAEGKAADIAQAYSQANSLALQAQKALTDTQVALSASNAALAKAKADAVTEQAAQSKALQDRLNAMQTEANARVAAAQAQAAADQRKLITWIFFGGGALLFSAGLAILLLAGSVPIFGPKAAFSVMASGGGLIFIGMVMNELAKHPWVIWLGICLCVLALIVAIGFILHNNAVVKAAVQPVVANVEAEAIKLVAALKAKLGGGATVTTNTSVTPATTIPATVPFTASAEIYAAKTAVQ